MPAACCWAVVHRDMAPDRAWPICPKACQLVLKVPSRVGADADNVEALTPLHCAALAGCAECAQRLLDAGADRAAAAADGRYAHLRCCVLLQAQP